MSWPQHDQCQNVPWCSGARLYLRDIIKYFRIDWKPPGTSCALLQFLTRSCSENTLRICVTPLSCIRVGFCHFPLTVATASVSLPKLPWLSREDTELALLIKINEQRLQLGLQYISSSLPAVMAVYFSQMKWLLGEGKKLCIRIEADIYILVLYAVMWILIFPHLYVTVMSSVCNYIYKERNFTEKLQHTCKCSIRHLQEKGLH